SRPRTKPPNRSLSWHLRNERTEYPQSWSYVGNKLPYRDSGSAFLPEVRLQRFDVSAASTDARRQPIERLLVELEVSPEQTGAYKANFHQQFMRNCMKAASLPRVFTFEQFWAVREACIHALEMHT